MDQTFGRYRLLERLGKGGMAEVFKAKSFGVEGFEKVLVVKRILPELARNARFVEMFVHEAKLSVRLSHANIVQAFDLGMVNPPEGKGSPSYFIAMEYVAGLDLAALIGRARRQDLQLPVGLCLFVASEVCKGLDHAHRRCDDQREPLGIVHRDVSPQNVLLSWEGDVKITDFGIAKARDLHGDRPGAVRDGRLAGKAAYMSPEQARTEGVDARSDIFSLGTLLYEMLTGVNPFRADTPGDTIARVQQGQAPPVHAHREDVDSALSAIVARAMAPDPRDRFGSAGAFHDELLAFMYASGTRFSANDLIDFLDPLRAGDGDELEMSDVLIDGSTSNGGEVTPAEVPELRACTPSVRVTTCLPMVSYASTIGERREVTAVVIRTTGVALPDAQRQRVKDTLARYGARLTDETREGLVSLLGLGDADGRETETAVRCALVVLRQLSSGRWRASAGVHAGRVQLHDSGEPARDETYTGVVEVASKLATVGDGRCVVSRTAARHVRNLFELEQAVLREPASLAGAGWVVGEPRTPDDALRRFVGREEEYRRMGKVLAGAARRKLQVVTVRGDQGIGKTRFVHALERRLKRGAYNIGVYLATCPPLGKEMPLSGMSSMLRVLCGVEEGDGPERIAAVEPRLRALGLTDEERGAVLGQLGASSIEVVGPCVPPLRSAFARMLQRLSEDRVHAFVWDDAQALDEETYDVLVAASKRLATARAVLVLCTRSFEAHPLSGHADHTYLDLGELADGEVAVLVAARAGVVQAPQELVTFCQQRAGGHPLFVEELVKELMETGALVVQEGRVESLRLTGEVAAPRPLKSLLAARMTRLDAPSKAVLHAAAVLGAPAHVEVLSGMLGMGLKQVESAIAVLEERGMMRRAGPSTSNMGSPLLREVVLESIAPESRRELHGAAAAAYEMVLGDQLEAVAERVGMHLVEAGERHRAARLFALSAKRRVRSGQLEGAVLDYLRALSYVDLADCPVDTLMEWLSDLRNVVQRVRSAPSLPELLERVIARVDKAGTVRQRVIARVDGAGMLTFVHLFDAATALVDAALELAGERGELRQLAMLAEAQIHGIRGEFGAAIGVYEGMGTVSFEGKDAYRYALGLAQAYGATGEKQRALEYLERATVESEKGDVGGAVEREKLRALIFHFSGDFQEAAMASARGADLAQSIGLSYETALGLHNLGDSWLWVEDFARSHAAFRQSLAIAEQYGYERLARHNRMYLLYLEGRQGAEGALDTLRVLVREADEAGLTWDVLDGRFLLGALAYRLGEAEVAREELERARILARECHSHLIERSAMELLGKVE
jgi:serine/threonine protein kinase/tetratricopeptide (TPR) repeat protein